MESNSEYGTQPIVKLSFPEAVRTRPGMYVGGTGFFGFIHYLVSPIVLLLAHGATRISVNVEDGFEITSDAVVKIERDEAGIFPFEVIRFEVIRSMGKDSSYEGTVLNALSRTLYVSVTTEQQKEELRFTRGVLNSYETTEVGDESPGTTLRFKPDDDIFTVTQISPAIFESYFRRLSFLHAGVRFSLSLGEETKVFQADRGIIDLYTAISSPYQLMHEPIQFVREEGNLKLQLVMAYHSWRTNHLWCFINNGRAVEGGSHEEGLIHALKRLRTKLELPERFDSGVVAVLSVQYPNVQWRGCIKARVANPELKMRVSRLVVEGTVEWLRDHPEVAAQISQLQTFTFPDEW